jgi:TRAP-type C4-dicarboxylate transport system permease large subunit
MIGGTTPPMAPALFTTCKCCGIKFEKALKPTLVLLIPLFIVLIILTFVPETVTFLPKLIGVY